MPLRLHFARSEIDSDQEKKCYACRYVDIDTEELWELRLEYSDHAKSFSDFVQAIYRLYPGVEGQRQWLMANMEKLVEERSRMGIRTLGDLGDYYRRFIVITAFLCGRNWLSNCDQSQAFMRGFLCELCDRVLRRLQLKFPDHLADDPYCLNDIYEVAQFILHGTATSLSVMATLHNPLIDLTPHNIAEQCSPSCDSASHRVTARAIASHCVTPPDIAEYHVTSLGTADHRATSYSSHTGSVFDRASRNRVETPLCNFCGRSNHFIRQCPDAEEYIQLGRCRQTLEGKIVLPTSPFVSRNIPGRFMKLRIDEWHHRNPGYLRASGYMVGIVPTQTSSGLSITNCSDFIARELDQP
ncbi:hypothetical protein PILCRDRAFT_15060 [Piloderma croceum F 1598]|uniref:CCHC-type domain-containing protein n=1 Tax=Piloderma croceum (strain F 1598) TaxID=765440 RepID=A0A0C3F0F8_PILCF|nr:hypothetical protein PILCRDRAFT_15060 [Piloderma croceum F 1598]